jgi:hypothetical protein
MNRQRDTAMLRFTMPILFAAVLAGCSAELKGPSAEFSSPLFRADHGHFCPPGQAKKGNC